MARNIERIGDHATNVAEMVYFAATGGAAALIAQRIKKAQVIAYEELGAEALQRLEVEDFPVIVVNDIYGGDAYEDGKKEWGRK